MCLTAMLILGPGTTKNFNWLFLLQDKVLHLSEVITKKLSSKLGIFFENCRIPSYLWPLLYTNIDMGEDKAYIQQWMKNRAEDDDIKPVVNRW